MMPVSALNSSKRVIDSCSLLWGKDSLMMIVALLALQRRADYDFELQVIHLDQHQLAFNALPMQLWIYLSTL